ncbi:hypothetical protein [Bradyrhizobium sp.]|uniref:hypothetical protein n=1 Tax=Bradyrhizobium sp. TaxID=376 RepID=UPI0007C8F3A7|nr:hypothetical protein [Bradyrhizobium sp.]
MKRDEVFPSRYLKCSDLNGHPCTPEIDHASFETLKGTDGKETQKMVLYFKNAKKALPLNATNYDSITAIVGNDDTESWPGHKIELYPDKTRMGGKLVDCVRVRAPAQRNLSKPPPPEAPPEEGLDDDIPF